MAEGDFSATAEELGSILTSGSTKDDTTEELAKGDADNESERDDASDSEKKDDAGKEGADKDKDGDADKSKDGASKAYDTFTVPEGVTVDEKVLAEFSPLLKGLGATQEQAQELIDLKVKMDLAAGEAQVQAWADTQKAWRETAEADPEYGGLKYEANIDTARVAVRKIGGDALVQVLTETGMGNHPEFIRAFVRIGEAIKEDTITFPSVGGSSKSLAERLFPNHKAGSVSSLT